MLNIFCRTKTTRRQTNWEW